MAHSKIQASLAIGWLCGLFLFNVSTTHAVGVEGYTPVNNCGVLVKPYATCSSSPGVLEKPTDDVGSEAVRFPDRQGWAVFLRSVAPAHQQAGSIAFLNAPWKQRRSTFSFENYWLRDAPEKFEPRDSVQQHLALAGSKGQAVEKELARCGQQAKDVVFFNDTLSRYIRDNDLWYRAGIRQFFNTGKPLTFPQGSIRLKSSWVKTNNVKDTGNFITSRDSKFQLWKMVSLHIATKQIPGWTWTTFEHRNNPCFNKSPKAQDSFGYPYGPQGEYSKELLHMAHSVAGTDARFLQLLEVITNYRLVGTMTDYVDTTGRPIVLGSSVTEAGTLQTASCKTCHSRAALNLSVTKPLGMLNGKGEGFIGSPQWQWFFFEGESGELKQRFIQTDFLWSLPLCAAATDTSVTEC
ncbi:hypothetical protein [Sansalvadorimonas verongulae]|uniref:hypothetical protein n=1 Tax=Sansalvadorimonas verongulae TaxID=2172824 RepID=UPI0012BC1565|nr:hypothetical protein [Sansalvadorimonas verongulae]MTI15359.1 hypothetical protein [Sansalvadorimonas verongulae]